VSLGGGRTINEGVLGSMKQRLVNANGSTVGTKMFRSDRPISTVPLLVALHGGTYTSVYFEVAGGPFGSFIEIANRNGFDVLTIDRPGYGESEPLPEDSNTFAKQAALLDEVVGDSVSHYGADAVVLVGHSIGGMIALEIAARQPNWNLQGVTATGMGARIPPGGAAEQLGSAPLEGVIDLPVPDRESVMFGPAGSVSEAGRQAARTSYAPTPFVELKLAPLWARTRLDEVAPKVTVPVHNVLAEFDALWDSSPEALADFQSRFAGGAGAISTVAPGVGHSIDHHLNGAATQLQQLAFAYSCTETSR
jgi:pimeloyl-ACP methyl ester carboxylesterase